MAMRFSQRSSIPVSSTSQQASDLLRAKRQWKTWVGLGLLTCWIAGLSIVSVTQLAGHWATLPHPEVGQDLENTAPGFREAFHGGDGIQAFHFLYSRCPCSQRVLDQILDRQPLIPSGERIVLIGHDPATEAEIKNQGYQLDVVTPQALKKRYGIQSAPLLVITNPDHQIIYSGGYTERKQGPNIQDHDIVATFLRGEQRESLPVFGCAVSAELQKLLDPLGLKYAQR